MQKSGSRSEKSNLGKKNLEFLIILTGNLGSETLNQANLFHHVSRESFIIIDNIVCTIHSMTCIYTGTWQWLSSQCKYMPIMHLPWYVHVFAVFPCICLLLANPLCMRFCIHQYCWQAKADSWCEFLLIQSLNVMYIQILLFILFTCWTF